MGNNNFDDEVEYLHSTDEREASEEPHGSSYSGQLVYKLRCSVLHWLKQIFNFQLKSTFLVNSVKGRARERYLDQLELTVENNI